MKTSGISTLNKIIWLDCDPGVDDMIAIMLAATNSNLKLVGISTVGGNTTIERVNRNTLNILNISGVPDIPVYQGLSEPLCRERPKYEEIDLGPAFNYPEHQLKIREENLFSTLSNVILSSLGKVTLIATGPLTNYALLLKTYPEVKVNIDSIVLMGGSIHLGNIIPSAEFNIFWDPEAAKIIFNSGVNLVMIPLEVTLKAKIAVYVLDFLNNMGSNLGRFLHSVFVYQNQNYQKNYQNSEGPLHDPCAVAYVINPELFQMKEMTVEIETKSEFCDGRTVCDVYNKFKKKKNALVAVDIEVGKFWPLVFEAWLICDKKSGLNIF